MTDIRRYAELHCHSYFSFLDGASSPEELVEEADRLGLAGLALTDHNGLYGVASFSEAARSHGLPSIFGSEIKVTWTAPHSIQEKYENNRGHPASRHLVVLAKDMEGYSLLSRTLSHANLAGGAKGSFLLHDYDIAGMDTSHWMVLTGCSKGPLCSALLDAGPSAAARELDKLIGMCGRDNVAIEIWNHGTPLDTARNDALAAIAIKKNVQLVATNIVHYARASSYRLASILAAVREGHTLEEAQRYISPNATASLRSAAEQYRRFARWPGAVERAACIAGECTLELHPLAPQIPSFAVPRGHSQQSWLAHLVEAGAAYRYGGRNVSSAGRAWKQIDHEMEVILSLGYAGYFLVVWDIVKFCRENGIYCQGRGSAANSAVCYSLGITQADPVSLGLLFERFLSPAREEPPDIDVDIEPQRRDEVIEYVYNRYGIEHVAQVSSVITYRYRSALRDLGKALGGPLVANSRTSSSRGMPASSNGDRLPVSGHDLSVPGNVDCHADLMSEMIGVPRHLGLHPGGIVVCNRPISEVCPVEHARRPGRTVLQWDKDGCAAMGLIKIDLLGLGILQAIHMAVDLI
ncbi:MAG: PHP domain-containing protein, partial [Actinobacteria bacterium]|nr:PHP domain-containing protein [Actinomycetota bacterium]